MAPQASALPSSSAVRWLFGFNGGLQLCCVEKAVGLQGGDGNFWADFFSTWSQGIEAKCSGRLVSRQGLASVPLGVG